MAFVAVCFSLESSGCRPRSLNSSPASRGATPRLSVPGTGNYRLSTRSSEAAQTRSLIFVVACASGESFALILLRTTSKSRRVQECGGELSS